MCCSSPCIGRFRRKEKRRVRSAFGQYLSPEVIRRLLVNPRLVEPRKTNITVMFSDIRGFTTISEKLDAQDLANFLNQYLSDMTGLVSNTMAPWTNTSATR